MTFATINTLYILIYSNSEIAKMRDGNIIPSRIFCIYRPQKQVGKGALSLTWSLSSLKLQAGQEGPHKLGGCRISYR